VIKTTDSNRHKLNCNPESAWASTEINQQHFALQMTLLTSQKRYINYDQVLRAVD